MDHTLINPNQIRMFGYAVSDDPFDYSRPFGISHDDLFIPFDTEGTAVFFKARAPTNEELDGSCPYIVLTEGNLEWDHSRVNMTKDRELKEYQTTIRAVRSGIHWESQYETDLILSSISDSLSGETIV